MSRRNNLQTHDESPRGQVFLKGIEGCGEHLHQHEHLRPQCNADWVPRSWRRKARRIKGRQHRGRVECLKKGKARADAATVEAKATSQQTVLHLRSPKEEERALQEKARDQSMGAGSAAGSTTPQHALKEEKKDRKELSKEKDGAKAGRARASSHG